MKWTSNNLSSLWLLILIRCSVFLWKIPTKVNALEPRFIPQFTFQPLIGGPSWLKLHVQVNLVDSYDSNDSNNDNNNTQIRHKFDFVPLDAADPKTLLRLLTLQSVPGQIRTFQSTHSPSLQFCQQYNTQLHLMYNNCWTFAWLFYCNALEQHQQEDETNAADVEWFRSRREWVVYSSIRKAIVKNDGVSRFFEFFLSPQMYSSIHHSQTRIMQLELDRCAELERDISKWIVALTIIVEEGFW